MKLEELAVSELMFAAEKMLENVEHIKTQSGGVLPRAVRHYVGMNYQLHCDELERRGFYEPAAHYRRQWKEAMR